MLTNYLKETSLSRLQNPQRRSAKEPRSGVETFMLCPLTPVRLGNRIPESHLEKE
jgi:hypothetical protein